MTPYAPHSPPNEVDAILRDFNDVKFRLLVYESTDNTTTHNNGLNLVAEVNGELFDCRKLVLPTPKGLSSKKTWAKK